MENPKLDEEDCREAIQDLINKLYDERRAIVEEILDLQVRLDKMNQFIQVISILSKKRA